MHTDSKESSVNYPPIVLLSLNWHSFIISAKDKYNCSTERISSRGHCRSACGGLWVYSLSEKLQCKQDIQVWKGQATVFFYIKRKMYRNSLQQQCELATPTNNASRVQNPQMPWKHKKTSTSLQLACLHLNINIYQRLIAVCFVLIHLHLSSLCFGTG